MCSLVRIPCHTAGGIVVISILHFFIFVFRPHLRLLQSRPILNLHRLHLPLKIPQHTRPRGQRAEKQRTRRGEDALQWRDVGVGGDAGVPELASERGVEVE